MSSASGKSNYKRRLLREGNRALLSIPESMAAEIPEGARFVPEMRSSGSIVFQRVDNRPAFRSVERAREMLDRQQSTLRQRAVEFGRLYAAGETLDEIAKKQNPPLTRERIRQILALLPMTEWIEVRAEHAYSRARQSEERYQRLEPEIAAAYRRLGTYDKVHAELGVPRNWVARAAKTLPISERRLLRKGGRGIVGVPKETLLEQIREAATALGEPLSRSSYDAYASPRGWRGNQTILMRFGSWTKACELAGVRSPRKPRRSYPRVSRDECLAAVVSVARSLDEVPTYEQYVAYSEAMRDPRLKTNQAGVLPSGSTIRKNLGTWGNVMRLVEQELQRSEAPRSAA